MVNQPMTSEARSECELSDRCQHDLDDGTKRDPIKKLRLLCLARGAAGFVGLGRTFRRMFGDGNRTLSFEEFKKGISDNGFECTDEELEEMFERFDTDENGSISVTEFLAKLRPPMNQTRLNTIGKCFRKLDKSGDGVITLDDLNGEKSEEQIRNHFLSEFEEGGAGDGRVTEEEFFNYYASISASIDDDTYFDLLLRQDYKL
uniref:Putative calcyphosin B n=1 Tax=Mayetiola destructor TaxID=39758 RepID=D1MLL5_MAYDE|nr:putative calcyphosin B [Mayetiola destructor]